VVKVRPQGSAGKCNGGEGDEDDEVEKAATIFIVKGDLV
jgi:hypothetical protein